MFAHSLSHKRIFSGRFVPKKNSLRPITNMNARRDTRDAKDTKSEANNLKATSKENKSLKPPVNTTPSSSVNSTSSVVAATVPSSDVGEAEALKIAAIDNSGACVGAEAASEATYQCNRLGRGLVDSAASVRHTKSVIFI